MPCNKLEKLRNITARNKIKFSDPNMTHGSYLTPEHMGWRTSWARMIQGSLLVTRASRHSAALK